MKISGNILIVVIVIAELGTEFHSVIEKAFSKYADLVVNWFYTKSANLNVVWYLMLMEQYFLKCVLYFVLCKLSRDSKYGNRLYTVCVIFFCYHLIDFGVYLYNYKAPPVINWVLLGCCVISILLIRPIKQFIEMHKV